MDTWITTANYQNRPPCRWCGTRIKDENKLGERWLSRVNDLRSTGNSTRRSEEAELGTASWSRPNFARCEPWCCRCESQGV